MITYQRRESTMPRKKVEEKDQELDTKKKVKKKTWAVRWFDDHCTDNVSDMRIVCGLVARSAYEQFHIDVPSGNNEIFAVVFYGTFTTILDWIRQKQKTRNEFMIEIAGSLNIGFTNNTDQNNEKVGNFMPVMEYIGVNRNIVYSTEGIKDELGTPANCIRWKELNIKKTADSFKEIQEVAYQRLDQELHVNLRTSEATIPLFCLFLDALTGYMRYKYQEAEGTDVSEISMNVLGMFDIYYSFDPETNQECIEYAPGVFVKLRLKSDDTAGREG